MIRETLQKIQESNRISATTMMRGDVGYHEVTDWLEANGGYESVDEYAKGNFGYKSSYSAVHGSVYSLTKSEFKKFEKAIEDVFELVEIDGNIDFGKINSKKSFKDLSPKAKLAVIYHKLSGNTDIQPSNISDLVVSVTTKKAVFTSNSATVDTGAGSISGMEDLPFGIKFSELKKIVKESK